MSATLSENSLTLFKARYLEPNETVDGLFQRVSGGNEDFYELFTSLDFLPNSPALFNAGTKRRGTVFACYHFCVADNMSDTRDGIMETANKAAIVAKWGGGVGYYTGNVRRKGSPIQSTHKRACGPVAVIKYYNQLRDLITQGGKRDLAQIAIHPSWHDDIEEFIDLKNDNATAKQLSSFNISVSWDDDAMTEVVSREKGRNLDLFHKQVDRAWRTGCPGCWFRGTVNRLNPTPYLGYLEGCNPCLTGDTVVYVADGRTSVRMVDLVKEGKDVPVFCADDDGQVAVRMMRNPRLTGQRKKIYKVTLDNGHSLRVTGNHKFLLRATSKREARYVETRYLKAGDSLSLLTRYTPESCSPDSPSRGDRYVGISYRAKLCYEHAKIAEWYSGRELIEGDHVHHVNEDRLDNSPENLEVVDGFDHLSKHSTGMANPNCSGLSNKQILQHGRRLAGSLGRRFSCNEWVQHARDNSLPINFSDWRKKTLGDVVSFSKHCAELEEVSDNNDLDTRIVRRYQEALEGGLDAEIVDGRVLVRRVCECCADEFTVEYSKREVSFCSVSCYNRKRDTTQMKRTAAETNRRKRESLRERQLEVYRMLLEKLGRAPVKMEWNKECKREGVSAEMNRKSSPFLFWDDLVEAAETYNHKVVSVEEEGYEDVYNGTVDDFHNFFVGGWDEGISEKGRRRVCYVNNLQCGEVDLYSDEPCDLGSMNLRHFVTKNRTVDFTRLYERARLAQRFLDYLHDINFIPVPEIMAAAARTRKTGLGAMGWADMLCLLHIHYDTQEAVDLAGSVMSCINEAAFDESVALAKDKGPFPGYDADKATTVPVRNSTRTCIAPTGSIYLLAGCDGSGIEPFFLLETERKTYEGIIMREKVKSIEESGGFIPKTASEIDWKWHVRHQAAFQKHTDLAVSKTINLPNSATREDVADAYLMMYELGCKGGTIYRDGCRTDQVLVKPGEHQKGSGFDVKRSVFTTETSPRRKMPAERMSITHKFKVDGTECFMTVGMFEDGKPGEIFIRASKMGSTISGILDTWAITFSLALQSGTSLESLCRHHMGTRFEPCGVTDNKNIPICTSIPDYVVRWMESKFLKTDGSKSAEVDSGVYCPECGKQALYQSGCLACSNKSCGWSKCG